MLDIAAESILGTGALPILDRELHDTRVSLDLSVCGEIKRLDPRDETFNLSDAWLRTHPRHKDRRVSKQVHQDLLALIIKIVASDHKGRTKRSRVLVDQTPPQDAASRARGHIKTIALESCLKITERISELLPERDDMKRDLVDATEFLEASQSVFCVLADHHVNCQGLDIITELLEQVQTDCRIFATACGDKDLVLRLEELEMIDHESDLALEINDEIIIWQ